MNPQEIENRGEHRDEKNRADQRDNKNREEQRKEKAAKPSRLGKEAKIGVAVILLLLGTFAAVVAVKMTKGDTDEKQLAVAEHEGERHKPLATQEDPLFSGVSEKSFGHHPTLVPPAKSSSGSLPGSVDSNLDKWKTPSERNEAKRVQSRYAAPMAPPSLPPSFAVDPPKPTHGSRYDLAGNNSLPGLEPEKPGRFGRKATDLPPPLPLPEAKKRPIHADSVAAVTMRESFERGESSGFADTDSGSRAGHHEKSRYEPSAALMRRSRLANGPRTTTKAVPTRARRARSMTTISLAIPPRRRTSGRDRIVTTRRRTAIGRRGTTASTKCNPATAIGRYRRRSTAQRGTFARWPNRIAASSATSTA